MSRDKMLKAFAEAMQDPEFKKASDDAHEAYVDALRGDIPKDWKYICEWSSRKAYDDMCEILNEHIQTRVFSQMANGSCHFTAFISPEGLALMRAYKESNE